MTTPLTPETSRRIEEIVEKTGVYLDGNLVHWQELRPTLRALASEIVTELAQSQGDGKKLTVEEVAILRRCEEVLTENGCHATAIRLEAIIHRITL